MKQNQEERTELQAIIKGKVQGVGFRWVVVEHAERHSLKGTVCNLPKGDVQVVAVGPKKELEAFIKDIEAEPGNGVIQSIHCKYIPSKDEYQTFSIIKG